MGQLEGDREMRYVHPTYCFAAAFHARQKKASFQKGSQNYQTQDHVLLPSKNPRRNHASKGAKEKKVGRTNQMIRPRA